MSAKQTDNDKFAAAVRPVVGILWVVPQHPPGFNGTGWQCRSKPSWLHRLAMRVLLGWVWEDV